MKVSDIVARVQSEFSRMSDALNDDDWIEANEELADYFETAARVRREELGK